MSTPEMVAPKLICDPAGKVRGSTTGPVAEGIFVTLVGFGKVCVGMAFLLF
jgi:hypothetical protein